MNILQFIITTFGLGILCSIPGIMLGKLLVNRRMVRELLALWLVGISVAGLFFLRLMLPQLPLWFLVVSGILIPPLAMYRADLWTYFLKGGFFKKDE